jgi:hypothetical protein
MTQNLTPSPATPPTLDAHGHNPDDYDWVPVLRKRRADGWSPGKQRAFIEALADTGSVMQAARSVGMSARSAQMLRRSPGAASFDRAWSAAIETASKSLIDEAFERALIGTDEPVFDREGRCVGRRHRKSDRLLEFLLRGYFPERFGYAAHISVAAHGASGASGAAGDQAAPPAALPVAEALAQLLPEPIAEPEKRLDPEQLEDALLVADLCDGKLPHWRRDH